jgi:hypothetical protein
VDRLALTHDDCTSPARRATWLLARSLTATHPLCIALGACPTVGPTWRDQLGYAFPRDGARFLRCPDGNRSCPGGTADTAVTGLLTVAAGTGTDPGSVLDVAAGLLAQDPSPPGT